MPDPDPDPDIAGLPPATAPHPLDHDEDSRKGGSKIKPVWIVTKGEGLHQVATSAVDAAISNGKGRRATDRDLAIAGVTGAPQEEV